MNDRLSYELWRKRIESCMLKFLFFFIIIIISCIASLNLYLNASEPEILISRFVDVHYFPQKERDYCGLATAQMILYELGEPTSQYTLKEEIGFVEESGTRNFFMVRLFKKHNIEIVSVGFFSSIRHLRDSVDKRQYSIINIKFDQKSKMCHYVLVVGYNETGFFLHDPWPEIWGKPEGRHSGGAAFISNELLGRLWFYRLNWVLTIAELDSNRCLTGTPDRVNSCTPNLKDYSITPFDHLEESRIFWP